jgi:hypothetical protein
LFFGEAEIDEHAASLGVVVEEVCGLDIAVEDAGAVDRVEGGEKRTEVVAHVGDEEVTVIKAEVEVAEVREDGYDLIEMSKSCQEGTDMRRRTEGVQDFELVLDAVR